MKEEAKVQTAADKEKRENIRITVHVFESEFCTRSYTIATGKGNQHIHWLASTATLLFGQDHYPNGRYVPNCLYKPGSIVPHPR